MDKRLSAACIVFATVLAGAPERLFTAQARGPSRPGGSFVGYVFVACDDPQDALDRVDVPKATAKR